MQCISTEGIIRLISKMIIMLLHFFCSFFLFVTSLIVTSYEALQTFVFANQDSRVTKSTILNDIIEASSLTGMRRSEERSTRTEERSKGWLGCATDRHGVQFWTTVGQIFQFIEQFFDFHLCAFNKSS